MEIFTRNLKTCNQTANKDFGPKLQWDSGASLDALF